MVENMEEEVNKTAIPPDTKKSSLTTRIIDFDKNLSSKLFQFGNGWLRFIFIFLEHTGNGLFWIPVSFAIWLSPWPIPPSFRALLLNLFLAFMVDLMVIGTLKSTVKRPRPIYNHGMFIALAPDKWSFPSGHSSRALLTAAFFLFCKETLKDIIVSDGFLKPFLIGLFVWAIATAFSRILLGRHFVTDVIVGSILGVLEGLFFLRYLRVSLEASEILHHLALECISMQSSCPSSISKIIR